MMLPTITMNPTSTATPAATAKAKAKRGVEELIVTAEQGRCTREKRRGSRIVLAPFRPERALVDGHWDDRFWWCGLPAIK